MLQKLNSYLLKTAKAVSRFEKRIKEYQEWISREDSNIYQTAIFTEHQRNRATHILWIAHHPAPYVSKIEPIREEQRKLMWHPNVQGPLEEKLYDGNLIIFKQDFEALPVFLSYFFNGNFQYAGEHSAGWGDIRSLAADYSTAEAFKARIQEYFDMKSYEEFRKFFTRSNLPDTHRKAIEELVR